MHQEPLLFPELNVPRHFDGVTYEPEEDRKRLTAQLDVVKRLMSDHKWWTIAQLADAIWKDGYRATHQGISARIRDLRKARFGGHIVDRRRRGDGKIGDWEYRLIAHGEALRRQGEVVRLARELEGEEANA